MKVYLAFYRQHIDYWAYDIEVYATKEHAQLKLDEEDGICKAQYLSRHKDLKFWPTGVEPYIEEKEVLN